MTQRIPNNYPPEITKRIVALEASGFPANNDPITLLTAVLKSLGFEVFEVGPNPKKQKESSWLDGRGCGPYVWFRSHEAAQLQKELVKAKINARDPESRAQGDAFERSMAEANLRERARLLAFLDEFYSERWVPGSIRLVISDLYAGSSLLKSQGSDVMLLPENEPQRAKYIQQSRAEVGDFAAFLVKKLSGMIAEADTQRSQ
jgi:hypothetical protein